VMLRGNSAAYKERVIQDREKSKTDIPAGFVMPTHESAFKKEEPVVDEFSWSDSDAESFGGSDSDEEMFDDDDEAGSGAESEGEDDKAKAAQ
jgi:ubiquitin-conjugating enzyme E2 R